MTQAAVTSLCRFRIDMARSLAKRGKDLLISEHLRKEVAALEPLEAYYIVKEIGVEDAAPILRNCTQEQIQAFIDLDCWWDDNPSIVELDAWLAPFAAEGPEALATALMQLDSELRILFLVGIAYVFESGHADDLPDPPKGIVRKTTVDGYFIIENRPDIELEIDAHVLVDALYRYDVHEAFRLLTAAIWEIPSNLEDAAYRFRKGRLEDLGFPSIDGAQKLFSRPPKELRATGYSAHPGDNVLPALYAASLTQQSLLSRALETMGDSDEAVLGHIENSLRVLINHAVIAYGQGPSDIQKTSEIAGRVRDTLSLGLESVLSPNGPHPSITALATVEAAAQLLKKYTLFDIFRHGHAETVQVAQSVREWIKAPAVVQWLGKTETESDDYSQDRLDRAFLRAFTDKHPLHGGVQPLKPDALRAFMSKQEIEDAAKRAQGIVEAICST